MQLISPVDLHEFLMFDFCVNILYTKCSPAMTFHGISKCYIPIQRTLIDDNTYPQKRLVLRL